MIPLRKSRCLVFHVQCARGSSVGAVLLLVASKRSAGVCTFEFSTISVLVIFSCCQTNIGGLFSR